jgi:hypothetical protein
MQELIKALIKAKAEFNPIQKDDTNPHYKRKYATLDAVLDAVTPALGKYGLVIIQTTEFFECKIVLRTHIFHESGENITYQIIVKLHESVKGCKAYEITVLVL